MHQERGGGGTTGSNPETRRRLLSPMDSVCAITDVGRVRELNEDTFHISDNGKMLIVADGIGGNKAGEVASALAVETLVEFFTAGCQGMQEAGAEPIETRLREAFETAHRKVLEASRHRLECRGMGTTLILAYVHDNRLYTCHVGDVRCYLRTATGMEQITRDHSVVGMLVQAGELTPEQARVHPRKNEILQAVGLPDGIVPEVNSRGLASGDCILLCSDGLWGTLSDEELCAVMDGDGSVRQRATQLVDRANDAGGDDNITVVLYEHVARGGHEDMPGEIP